MNNDGNHYYYNHPSRLCTPTFHVDCTYLTIEELDFLIVLLYKNENSEEKKKCRFFLILFFSKSNIYMRQYWK